ncbi:hypothetical protein FT663_04247 [Candidozyma haemuli var. vulneris]|nr:hypothetical protein FT662_03734 [[Candida] haemuloni var. vulneris]KAF3987909.1 hypothetical protein FT663_04247 [[Candida] haemuloni var. vulneris]
MPEKVQKRHRRVFSCTNCRRKKRRCDRGVPCGECSRNGLSDCCSYEDVKPYKPLLSQQGVSASSSPSYYTGDDIESYWRQMAQVKKENDHGALGANDWEYNLFEASNTSKDGKVETSLLGYITMAGADPFTDVVKHFFVKQKSLNRLWSNLISKDGMVPKEKLGQFEQKAMVHFGDKHLRRLNNQSTDAEYNAARQAITAGNIQHGLTFKPDSSWTTLSLSEQVLQMLPPYSVVLSLVREFFSFQQKWLPVLDEKEFFAELNRVVGPTLEGHCIVRSLKSPRDAAILASLLLAIRLAYSMVVETKADAPSIDRTNILEHPVPIDAAEVAIDLTKELSHATSAGTHGLRALMMLQTFNIFSPERGMVTDHFSGLEIMKRIQSYAEVLHLGIDRSVISRWRHKLEIDAADTEDGRALWHTIIRLDTFVGILFDRGATIHQESYNVEYPSAHHPSEAAEIFCETRAEFMALRDLLTSTSPLASKLRYSELVEKIHRLEDAVEQKLGKPGDYLRPLDDEKANLKCSKFILLVLTKTWLSVIYSSLYLFFENKGEIELSVHYVKKRFGITQKDFGFLKAGLLDHLDEYFGPGSLALLKPILVNAIASQVGAGGIRVRAAFTLRQLERQANQDIVAIKSRNLYESVVSKIFGAEESALELAEAMAEKFHYAWAVSRSTRFGQKMISDEGIFDTTEELSQRARVYYTVDQLKSIDSVLNDASVEHKSYNDMYGEPDKDSSSEARELRLLNALQMEKKWSSIAQISTHAQKCTFNKRAGLVAQEQTASVSPIETWQYDLELLQGYDPSLLTEFFGNPTM